MTEKHIVLEDIDPVVFYGVGNSHLQMLKALFPKLRIMARDSIDREAALARIRAQKPDSYYRTHCTHLLFNNADMAGFAAACRQLYKEIYHG